MTHYEIYKQATFEADQAYQKFGDDGYGCGTSFVTIKWGSPFMRWAKKEGLAKKDGYYGWILDTQSLLTKQPSATLAEEAYNEAFVKALDRLAPDVHTFAHCRLN